MNVISSRDLSRLFVAKAREALVPDPREIDAMIDNRDYDMDDVHEYDCVFIDEYDRLVGCFNLDLEAFGKELFLNRDDAEYPVGTEIKRLHVAAHKP